MHASIELAYESFVLYSEAVLFGLTCDACLYRTSLLVPSIIIYSTLLIYYVNCFDSAGPNDLSLFQPKCPDTHDLASKLFVYYHAKAVKEMTCLDLSPYKAGNKSLNGRFIGQHYITWDIKVYIRVRAHSAHPYTVVLKSVYTSRHLYGQYLF